MPEELQKLTKLLKNKTKAAYEASDGTIEKAFKGANVTNIKALAKDIDTSINTYTAGIMKVFETYATDLKTKYKSQDTSASAVSNVRQSIKS